MNERIEELAEQAENYAYSVAVGGDECQEAYTKKFAELIVRECADTVLGFHNKFGDSAHNEIREHFGFDK